MNATTTRTFRALTAADLTPERKALINEMISTYDGGHADLIAARDFVNKFGPKLTDTGLLTLVNTTRTPVAAPAAKAQVKSGTYTIVNPKTGGYRTIQLDSDTSWMQNPPAAGTRIAKFLNGPDNETSFTGFAFVTPDGGVKVWGRYHNETAIVAALTWLLANGAGQEATLGKAYAVRSGRCCFCCRKLTTPGSVHFGYGPDCADKNGLPWTDKVAPAGAAATARVGFQRVATSPAAVTAADGSVTMTDAAAKLARYRQLFGED